MIDVLCYKVIVNVLIFLAFYLKRHCLFVKASLLG